MIQVIDVKQVRQSLNLTQEQFANRFHFTLSTLRQWEQGRRAPPRSTTVLLKVIAFAPEVVERAIRVA